MQRAADAGVGAGAEAAVGVGVGGLVGALVGRALGAAGDGPTLNVGLAVGVLIATGVG